MSGVIPNSLKRLAPQLVALVVILALNAAISPGFLDISYQNGRLYGSLIDILNRGAPVALLAIGMTLVIATKGIDLSVGAVMAITGAVAAAMITSGSGTAAAILAAIGVGILCGLWNGALVSLLSIQPIIATLIPKKLSYIVYYVGGPIRRSRCHSCGIKISLTIPSNPVDPFINMSSFSTCGRDGHEQSKLVHR